MGVKGELGGDGPCEKAAEGPSVGLAARVLLLHVDTCCSGQVPGVKAAGQGSSGPW